MIIKGVHTHKKQKTARFTAHGKTKIYYYEKLFTLK